MSTYIDVEFDIIDYSRDFDVDDLEDIIGATSKETQAELRSRMAVDSLSFEKKHLLEQFDLMSESERTAFKLIATALTLIEKRSS